MNGKKGDIVVVRVKEGFLLTRDDSTRQWYDAGLQPMPRADAEHEYTGFFLEQAPAPALGDFEFASAKRKHAEVKRTEWVEAEAAAVEAEEAFTAASGQSMPGAPPPRPEPDEGSDEEEEDEDEGADEGADEGKDEKAVPPPAGAPSTEPPAVKPVKKKPRPKL